MSDTQNNNYPPYIELKLRPRVWLYSSREENLRSPIYGGRRENLDPAVYDEYMPSWDNGHMVYAANKMSNAFPAIRGNDYKVEQLAGLYPTSEASDDYAYSRCFVDKNEEKVHTLFIELGDEFVPPMAEVKNIIKGLCSAMTAFCSVAMDEQ